MLIGISGNICAGKTEAARFLRLQGFSQIYLKRRQDSPTRNQCVVATPDSQQCQFAAPPQITTIPGTPMSQATKESEINDDDTQSNSDGGTSNSVKNLIHELTDMSTDVVTELPDPYPAGRSSTFPSFGAYENTHNEPMARWNGPTGEQVIDTNGCALDLTFDTVEELRDYVTRNWQTNYVTTDIFDLNALDTLSQRPFFLHIAIDAPVSLRWRRYSKKQSLLAAKAASPLVAPTLESFISLCDQYMYTENGGMAVVVSRARLTVVNQTQSPELLYVKLANLNLADPVRLRPSWDSYFMRLANLAALRANCMKRQVGCVLVRDKRVIATGYNGTPRGLKNCNEGGCGRCNDSSNYSGGMGLSTCLCLHAEENALLESGRDRIGEGSILYCNTCPCLTCSIKIVQSGIREVVYLQPYSMDKDSEQVFNSGNTIIRQFIPPSEGLSM